MSMHEENSCSFAHLIATLVIHVPDVRITVTYHKFMICATQRPEIRKLLHPVNGSAQTLIECEKTVLATPGQ